MPRIKLVALAADMIDRRRNPLRLDLCGREGYSPMELFESKICPF
jgi:hypothetical protein